MAPADMLADERRLLKLAARAAAREAARVLDLLPANVATPRGPVAVTSQLRRSAACWAAHARAEDTKGFRADMNAQRTQAARSLELMRQDEQEKKARRGRSGWRRSSVSRRRWRRRR